MNSLLNDKLSDAADAVTLLQLRAATATTKTYLDWFDNLAKEIREEQILRKTQRHEK